jgi:hypothetical protein
MSEHHAADESVQSKGGKARAERLTPEERKQIARKGAEARWGADVPQATHEGSFSLGNTEISGAVLPNGKRLITQATFLRALGRARSPKAGTGVLTTVDGIPFFLQADALQRFVDEDLMMSTTPIFFREKGGKRSVGYDAELLPRVADVYLKMRDHCAKEGKPVPRQYEHIVRACDLLMRGLAHVGIVALVDEATGYQDLRAAHALAEILEAFIAKELRKWVRTFDPEFYKQIFRLKGWVYNGSTKRPRQLGKITNDLVYERLAPGVLQELRQENPADERGYRKAKHHQWLTPDIGHPKLREHLKAVTTLAKAVDNWDEFYKMIGRALPKQTPMPLFDHLEENRQDDEGAVT